MKNIRRFSAVLLGFVFCIAGVLKLMDPVGAGLVVDEYFKFLHLRFLCPASGVIGSMLALAESILGAALITGVWRKITGILSGVMMAFFTLLTLVLVIANPSMDCGCFGEAIHLTHFQSFVKNLVLCAFWVLAFVPFRSVGDPVKIKYVSFSLAAASLCLFLAYSAYNIPMMDFTSYKPGADLQQPEEAGDDAPSLIFSNAEGEYCDSLALSGRKVVANVYDVEKLSEAAWNRLAGFFTTAEAAGYEPILLVAATPSSMEYFGVGPEFIEMAYYADRRELLTLNRSNAGITMLEEGQIVGKWASRSYPDAARLAEIAAADPTEAAYDISNPRRLRMQGFLLYISAVMLLL